MWSKYRIFFFLVVVILSACDEGSSSVGKVKITDADGNTPREYFVVFTSDASLVVIRCDADGLSDQQCTSYGIDLLDFSGSADIHVKARFFEFEHRSLQSSAVSGQTIKIPLQSKSDLIQNEDYATGFYPEQGPEDFITYAYPGSSELGRTYSVKFYIDDIQTEPKVYFQNTIKHQLHYDFVHDVLGKTLNPIQFTQQTYIGPNRRAMAGTIVYYPDLAQSSENVGAMPFTLNFFPSDDLTPEQAVKAHQIIEAAIGFVSLEGTENRLVYIPAGEIQESEFLSSTTTFTKFDAPAARRQDLYGNITMQLLNEGVAYGTLKLMTPEELETQVVSFSDIVILTRLPNDLPLVGGTITMELQTPLAHVNIAARNRGTPNMALLNASTDERITPFIGKLVRFEVTSGGFTVEETTLAEAQEYWNSLHPDPLFPEYDLTMEGLPRFSELDFGDSVSVGVKASNLAQLRQLLPDNTSDGFAVPFRYYDEFTKYAVVTSSLCNGAQYFCSNSGRQTATCDEAHILCKQITSIENVSINDYLPQMLSDDVFIADAAVREASLMFLRYFFTANNVQSSFAAMLNARVTEIFGSGKVKLRSSTNAEDLPAFSGAGLYSSFGAHSSGEDAASLIIRETWASVWNWKAFEERSLWNIDHLSIKMGVAVNMAFTDEAANGVILTQNIADPATGGMYVNVQKGEVSVTNPTNGELPEIFTIIRGPAGTYQPSWIRFSSLSPDISIMTSDEISSLHQLSQSAHGHFSMLYGISPFVFTLDMEFKLWGNPRKVYLKQARPYSTAN
ncbi:hypothetical protein KKF34_13710 [Myxococcota bacterium]|nr:hypothetical protein [Myxococcota bacterium]MBU1380868.1 hypothetical protein [Myxococcota bacterium]MBU1497927.1 hypothetical protein [Myxococcota bacterium]